MYLGLILLRKNIIYKYTQQQVDITISKNQALQILYLVYNHYYTVLQTETYLKPALFARLERSQYKLSLNN